MKTSKFFSYLSALFTLSVLSTQVAEASNITNINPYIPSNSINIKTDKPLSDLNTRFYINEKMNKVYISSSEDALKYQISNLSNPNQLVIDTYGTTIADFNKNISTDSNIIDDIRYEYIKAEIPKDAGVRVFINTKGRFEYNQQLMSMNHTLEISLSAKEEQVASYPMNKTVVLDPGHGGNDPGAIGLYGTKEKDVNLSVSKYLRDMLIRDGIRVIMTRNYDQEVYLQPRTDLANNNGADLFLSIHANANTTRSIYGTETYYKTPQSKTLSQVIHKNLINNLGAGVKDRGIKTANFFVIKRTTMPSVLAEIGFISNPQEEAKLASSTYQKKIASSIYKGIKQYFSITNI